MSLRERDVHVTRPCPIDLDQAGMRGQGDAWHCGHCSKTVHVLSSMTEYEAQVFMREHAGQDVCVSYSMTREGEIRFRPAPVVPISALSRRPRIAAAAAIGLSAAMAACAPHENPRVEPAPMLDVANPGDLPIVPVQRYQPVRQPEPEPEPELVAVAGGMMIAPPPVPVEPPKPRIDVENDVQVDGGMRMPTLAKDEPCDPPKPTEPTVRGGLRAPAR